MSAGPNEDEAQACLSALFLTNPRDDRAQLIVEKGPRVDGTCQWIKSHALYKSWLCSNSQLLWLCGGPGKGKTMLSIFLAEELEENAISQNKLFLQYFCNNKDEKRNTAVAVLRGLIFQLLRLRPKLFDHILPVFKILKTSLFSLEMLWKIFERMVCDPALETTNCVLDGLDECDEASLEVLLGNFVALFSANNVEPSACNLNLLIVCRGSPDFIPFLLSSFPRISLDSDASPEVNKNIDIFIEAKVEELSRHGRYPKSLRIYVEKVFRERAQVSFLWVGIVAKALANKETIEVEEALRKFPPGLNELYARILLQIDSGRREIAARILRWVVIAVRPLTLLELSFAVEPTISSSIVANRDERIRDQISYCGDFLVIKEDENDENDEEDEEEIVDKIKVGLIHQSAKEYLLRKMQDSNPNLESFRIDEDVANLEIARRCLDYLQSGALENSKANVLRNEEHLRRFPLLSYAALHWHEHARFLARSADVFDLSQPFWAKESEIRTSWLKAYWHSDLVHLNGYSEPPKSFTLLHIASFIGIVSLAENIISGQGWMNKIKRLFFLNKIDSYRMTALMWAAKCGHEAVVRLLLENGADPEIKNENQMTALTIAVEHGHEAIVRLLLENEADIELRTMFGETALTIAVSSGHEAIVQLLLDSAANTEFRDFDGETALMKATRQGHGVIVQLLLEKGARVEIKGISGETALTIAASSGHAAIMQLLLEQGANPNAESYHGETALMKAVEKGSQAILDLLLESGAYIDFRYFDGETALIIAIREQDEAVMQVLLEYGADPNAGNEHGETALIKAVEKGSQATIELLLEAGAGVGARNIDGETALMKAAVSGQKTVAHLLLDRGEDVEARNLDGETAMIKAIRQGDEAVMQLLLDHGADPFAENNDGETALAIAKRKGNEEMVRLLSSY